jgi:hypothetical protein
MFRKSGKFVFLIAMAVTLFTACAAPRATLPTPDLNLVRTEAVVTAVAQLTKQAALVPQPSQTPLIPTITVAPTLTPLPFVITATPFYSGGGSSGGGSGSGGGSISGTPIPSWTPIIYKAKLVDQFPLDGYICPTGEEPDLKWTLQNLGVVTWDTTHYYIRRLYNNPDIPLTKSDTYPLPADTPPGAKVTLAIDILCPKFPGGPWLTQWELIGNGQHVGYINFRFYTGLHATATPIKTNTPSPG